MQLPSRFAVRDVESPDIDRYLMPHEGETITLRRHPAMMRIPAAVAVVGLVAALLGSAFLRSDLLILALWIIFPLLVAHLAARIYIWSGDFFVVTDYRVMVITGLINRRVLMMPLGKIVDIKLERTPIGRMMGYGTIILESPGQVQALQNVDFMPYPEQMYLEISSLAFPVRDESPD
jgi:membrane protein YdbS with pleckstrin-like domain